MSESNNIELNLSEPPLEIKLNKTPSQIQICDGKTWVLNIGENGIVFNHERFPEWKPNDFALEFVRILEECLEVKLFPKDGSLFKKGKIHQ